MRKTTLTRRSFLKLSLLAAPVLAGLDVHPTFAAAAKNPLSAALYDPLTGREAPDFHWPSDITGSESFWGNDILITLDDCHLRDWVRRAFDLLYNQRGLRVTLFPNSNYLPLDDPEIKALWRDIYQAGFEIGYHTTNHYPDWTRPALEADFAKYTDHMRQLFDAPDLTIRFVRPPYGNWNSTWLDWAAANGLTNVRWNFVPDGQSSNTIEAYLNTIQCERGGRIILMHPREWDCYWLETHLDGLVELAREQQGRISTLSGSGSVPGPYRPAMP